MRRRTTILDGLFIAVVAAVTVTVTLTVISDYPVSLILVSGATAFVAVVVASFVHRRLQRRSNRRS